MESEPRKRQKVNDVSESGIQIEEKFGYAGFTPSWLQWLNNPWCFLVGVIGLTFGQGKLESAPVCCAREGMESGRSREEERRDTMRV